MFERFAPPQYTVLVALAAAACGEATAPIPLAPPEWSLERPAGPRGIRAIGGTSATDMYAVGDQGTLFHYDGGEWTRELAEQPVQFVDIWVSPEGPVYVVGSAETGGVMYRRDQAGWEPVAVGTVPPLRAIWGSSATDVFAAGETGTILHFDGSDWAPQSSGITDPLTGLWGSSPSDVFAVGGYSATRVLHFNGTTWAHHTFLQQEAHGIWGSSPSDVFVVGANGKIHHYDGAVWSEQASGTSLTIDAVSGRSATDVWAVASFSSSQLLHYDGSTWRVVETGTPGTPLGAFWVRAIWAAPLSVVIGGLMASGDPVPSGAIAMYDGTTIELSLTGAILRDVWAASPSAVYAVGDAGTVLRFDGQQWLQMPTGTGSGFSGVWGTSDRDVWAVGAGGTYHYDGSAWSKRAEDPAATAIWGPSSSDLFSVGADGTVRHYDGQSWVTQRSGQPGDQLYGVAGRSPTDVFTVGYESSLRLPLIFHYDGRSWTRQPGSQFSVLRAVWTVGETEAFAVGSVSSTSSQPAEGTILRYDGVEWLREVTLDAPALSDVWGTSESDIIAVGAGTTMLHFDGSAWTRAVTDSGPALYGVSGAGNNHVWAVGARGVIYHGSR